MVRMHRCASGVIVFFLAAVLSIAITGCAAPSGAQRIDNIAMYGQPSIKRPTILKGADEAFIATAAKGFGSREKASVAWALQAEEYFKKGNYDYAMRRYNQSWLLNPNNYLPYWGFGMVTLQQDKFDESIAHFEKAKQLVVEDLSIKSALLSDAGSAYLYKARSLPPADVKEVAKYYSLANQSYAESTKYNPNNPYAWRRWAISLYWEGKYADAWEKVKKARSLGADELEKIIESLNQKMPMPD